MLCSSMHPDIAVYPNINLLAAAIPKQHVSTQVDTILCSDSCCLPSTKIQASALLCLQ
jgi:hypothetical protein